MADSVIAAGELLAEQRCSAPCVLAIDSPAADCDCRCGGRWHGILADVPVPANSRPWYERHCCYSTMYLDTFCPVVDAQHVDRAYGAYVRAGRLIVLSYRTTGRRWRVYCDTDSLHDGVNQPAISEPARRLLEGLVQGLVQARRVERAFIGAGTVQAHQVVTQMEAQVLGAICGELFHGNGDGAWSCLYALHEDGHVPGHEMKQLLTGTESLIHHA